MSESATILVIDDLDTNLFMLSTLLKREGFSVLTAASGPEGRALAREERPDLILLDIMMPGENGFQTCDLLKRDRRTASIPVVFLSALEDTESRAQGLHLGAVDFVSKPFMREEVLARLRAQLRRVRLEPLLVRSHVEAIREAEKSIPAADPVAGDPPAIFGNSVSAASFRAGGSAVVHCAEVAPGISGVLFAVPAGDAAAAARMDAVFRSLLDYNSSVLNQPEDTFRLINAEFCSLFPLREPLPACWCLVNRNSSRLNVVSGGPLRAFVADGTDGADGIESMELGGDELGIDPEAAFLRAERPVKPGMRVVVFLGLTGGEIDSFALDRSVESTLSVPAADQVRELAFAFGDGRRRGACGVCAFSI
jgi:sigma-B regulation protein RsbU (phosphoserine phosphatase)